MEMKEQPTEQWPNLFVSFEWASHTGKKRVMNSAAPFPKPLADVDGIEELQAYLAKAIGAYAGEITILNWRRMEADPLAEKST